jgi:hypothetical protein
MSGLDNLLVIVMEHIPKTPDALGEDGLAQDATRPNALEQFVLGANLACVLQQINQYFERLSLDLRINTVNEEFMRTLIKNRAPKMPAAARGAS